MQEARTSCTRALAVHAGPPSPLPAPCSHQVLGHQLSQLLQSTVSPGNPWAARACVLAHARPARGQASAGSGRSFRCDLPAVLTVFPREVSAA